jgi:hypothetical protein
MWEAQEPSDARSSATGSSAGGKAGRRAQGTQADPAIPLSPTPPAQSHAEADLVADERPAAARGRAQLIEPGRALMLADFGPPKVAAGERLIRLAYRMGVSGGALTAPFRKPPKLRLLAAVANPLPGERAAGMALRSGHFLVHGLKLPIMQVDFSGAARLAPPIERVVHGFHWLADLEVAGQRDQKLRDQMLPVAERILNGWLLANPKALAPRQGAGVERGQCG